MNKVMIMGRLTRDPEIQYSKGSNVAFVKGTLAVNERYGNNEKTSFINFVAFRKLAELMSTYKRKGDKVAITGKLESNNYTNGEGIKKYSVDVIVDNIEFISANKSSRELIASSEEEFEIISDENVPF